MSKAIRIHKTGGPEVLQFEDVDVPAPGPGEARVRHRACGVNYIDIYYRTGLYPTKIPGGLGCEGAGEVEAVGANVTGLKPGDRVAYAPGPNGAYSEVHNVPAAVLVKLPDALSFEQAAAIMEQGMTVQYLIKRTYKVQKGETVLWHAAAGGVGLVACQWLSALGVTVIGTAGSDEKCALAKANGAAHVINYRTENFAQRVKEITGGQGLGVVYDSVGKDTFEGSLECLRPFGMMVSFGNASGAVPPVNLGVLRGSLYLTRPSLGPYVARRADLEATAKDVFEAVLSGKVKAQANQRYALKDAAQAQRDIEARKTTGSTILVP